MNVKERIKIMQIIHFSLFMGVTLFLAVIFFIGYKQKSGNPTADTGLIHIMQIISFGFYAVSIILGRIFHTARINSVSELDLGNKLSAYQASMITRDAIIEAGVLISHVSLFLYISSGGSIMDYNITSINFLSYIVYTTFWMNYFPSKEKIAGTFNIDIQELKG